MRGELTSGRDDSLNPVARYGGSDRLLMRLALGVAAVAIGCGGEESRRPDTGYGAGQPAPAMVTCANVCARFADCMVALCNEDTRSTRYDLAENGLALDCEARCTDAELQLASAVTWACYFESSCREVVDYSICQPGASYYCN